MQISLSPIGYLRTEETELPRHWSVSDRRGRIELEPQYAAGLQGIEAGQEIVALFAFHRSEPFSPERLIQRPPHSDHERGVFATCSPHRPNPIGLSVLQVLEVGEAALEVARIDMVDGTPILDIKPHIAAAST